MYGTMARIRPAPGKTRELEALGRRWQDDPGSRPEGLVNQYLLIPDGRQDEVLLFVVFESKEAYWANARSPEQDARYREFRALLTEDPVWTDGEIRSFQPTTVPI